MGGRCSTSPTTRLLKHISKTFTHRWLRMDSELRNISQNKWTHFYPFLIVCFAKDVLFFSWWSQVPHLYSGKVASSFFQHQPHKSWIIHQSQCHSSRFPSSRHSNKSQLKSWHHWEVKAAACLQIYMLHRVNLTPSEINFKRYLWSPDWTRRWTQSWGEHHLRVEGELELSWRETTCPGHLCK